MVTVNEGQRQNNMDIEIIINIIKEKIKESEDLQQAGILKEPFFVGSFDVVKAQYALEFIDTKHKTWLDSDGNLYIFGLPSFCHDTIPMSISNDIFYWTIIHDLVEEKDFSVASSPRCKIGRGHKEPDLTYIDLHFNGRICDNHRNQYPTFVVEVSVSNESWEMLVQEVEDLWLSSETSVMSGLGIDIFGKKIDGTYAMRLIYKKRNSDAVVLEFGTDLPNPPNTFSLDPKFIFPSKDLTDPIQINLRKLRDIVIRTLE